MHSKVPHDFLFWLCHGSSNHFIFSKVALKLKCFQKSATCESSWLTPTRLFVRSCVFFVTDQKLVHLETELAQRKDVILPWIPSETWCDVHRSVLFQFKVRRGEGMSQFELHIDSSRGKEAIIWKGQGRQKCTQKWCEGQQGHATRTNALRTMEVWWLWVSSPSQSYNVCKVA